MLAGYWLLSDLDGTLVATPHKANGGYLSLTQSPCYRPIRRWLLNRGSLCVVTTADQRALEQIYIPLRDCLRQDTPAADAEAAGGSAGTGSLCMRRGPGGVLLFCLYTGAVLYRCTAEAVEVVPHYTRSVHCATHESVLLARRYRVSGLPSARIAATGEDSGAAPAKEGLCVRGTCLDAVTTTALLKHIVSLYEDFLYDVLRGEPVVVAGLCRLSLRYRRLWLRLLRLFDTLYRLHTGDDAGGDNATDETDLATLLRQDRAWAAAQTAAAVEWKMRYFRTHRDMLRALGILRVEYIAPSVHVVLASAAGGTPCDTPRATPARLSCAERDLVTDHAAGVLGDGLPETLRRRVTAYLTDFARETTGLLGLEGRHFGAAEFEAAADDDATAGPQTLVAQVILLGFPFTLFSRYFVKSLDKYVRIGVHTIPQPNSIVFSKLGVSKSTALRYLLGKDRVTTSDDAAPVPRAVHAENDAIAASVRCGRCVALGDNPQTSDYELTVFPDVTFISLERDAQRNERHARITRRLSRTRAIEARGGQPRMPDGGAAPSSAELLEQCRCSGPMMDDTLLKHLLYVGGEEDGTTYFLEGLMNELHIPVLPPTGGALSSIAAMTEAYDTLATRSAVGADAFQAAVAIAAARARHRVQHSQAAKL